MTTLLRNIVPGNNVTGYAILDFGNFPGTNNASVVVTGQTQILSTAALSVYVNGEDTTTDHSAQDHRLLPTLAHISVGNITNGSGFTIYATSLEKLSGTFKIRWAWSY